MRKMERCESEKERQTETVTGMTGRWKDRN